MAGSASTEEARGALGALRRLLHAPELTAEMGCLFASGAALVAATIAIVTIYLAMNLGGDEPAQTEPEQPATQTAEQVAAPEDVTLPAVENPTEVGQAVAAVAQPAIEEVFVDAVLTQAPDAEALIMSFWYQIPVSASEGDGEKLRDAFEANGATPDPDNSEMDYHSGEEFMMLIDTGNPAYKTVRVSVIPGDSTVYVNADKSE